MLKNAAKILLMALPVLFLVLWLNCPADNNEMVTMESARTLSMSRTDAWGNLQDLTLAHHYVPGIIKTEITTEQKTGVGASRRVYQSTDTYLNETVIEWNQGNGFLLHLFKDNGDAPFPFKYAEFRYQLDDSSNGTTQIKTSLSFQMAGGCLGYWVSVLLAGEFQKRTDEVADNLKIYYESL